MGCAGGSLWAYSLAPTGLAPDPLDCLWCVAAKTTAIGVSQVLLLGGARSALWLALLTTASFLVTSMSLGAANMLPLALLTLAPFVVLYAGVVAATSTTMLKLRRTERDRAAT